MSDREQRRALLNQKIRAASGAQEDIVDKGSADRVVQQVSSRGGWSLVAWTDSKSKARGDRPIADWSRGKSLSMRRSQVKTVKRHPAHQALVEWLGQVAPGDDEYQYTATEMVSAHLDAPERSEDHEVLDVLLEVVEKAATAPPAR